MDDSIVSQIASMVDKYYPVQRVQKLNTRSALAALVKMTKHGLTYRLASELLLPGIHYSTLAKRVNQWAANRVFEKCLA